MFTYTLLFEFCFYRLWGDEATPATCAFDYMLAVPDPFFGCNMPELC